MSAMLATATNPLRVGLRQERVIAPQCLVIFGASGDLTHRKLVPALFELFKQRRLPSEFALLGCARRPWSDEEFRGKDVRGLGPADPGGSPGLGSVRRQTVLRTGRPAATP